MRYDVLMLRRFSETDPSGAIWLHGWQTTPRLCCVVMVSFCDVCVLYGVHVSVSDKLWTSYRIRLIRYE